MPLFTVRWKTIEGPGQRVMIAPDTIAIIKETRGGNAQIKFRDASTITTWETFDQVKEFYQASVDNQIIGVELDDRMPF